MFFKDDGTKMYMLGSTGDTIREFTLSTAWDVSTISFRRAYFVGFLDTVPAGLFFKSDGTQIYIAGAQNRTAYQLSLTTAWDSASVTGRFYIGNEEITPQGIFIKPDGLKMYITGQTGDAVDEYDLGTAWDISTASFVRVSAAVGDTSPNALWFKDDGTKMYIAGSTNDTVREFTLSTPWNVSTISFSKSRSIGFETVPTGVAFKDDGSMLYVVGHTNDTVYQIQLGTAWDVGTAKDYIYVGASESVPRGLHINNDGALLFLSGNGGSRIYKYTLSTAYALETATLSQSFSLLAAMGAHVSADGLKIYAVVNDLSDASQTPRGGRTIRQITLTSPNDLATASRSNVELIPLYGFTGASSDPWGVRVSPDGTRMFLLSDAVQGLYQFSLRFA
jgi:sugar lactone lactonase YvrE